MGATSVGHWLIVMVVIALVFGPKRLGNMGKGLGEGLKGLRDGLASRGEEPSSPIGSQPRAQRTEVQS